MAAKAGAGASVSSGAGYQARIGGYLLVASFCDIELDITKNRKVRSISFETIEDIDDINLNLSDGRVIYIQAKAKIHYSISRDGELYLVLKQFEGQHCTRPNHGDHYCLVTGGRSSRKVTHDMRAALDAFRLTRNDQHFHRDQPKVLVQIIGDLLNALQAIQTASGRTVDSETAHDILRKTFVLVWDLESGDPMEQGAVLLLASRHFLTPAVLWGKIISDCVGHAKSRHTVDVTMAAAEYERFRAKTPQTTGEASDDLMRIDFGTFDFPVGREVVLVRMPSGTKEVAPRLMIMEFYRFDDDCAERIEFAGNTLRLTNGLEMQLIRRAATQTGLLRLIEANRALIGDEELTLVPLNSDENFERGTCAQLHRERLRQAALSNPSPLRCIHCGRPISSNRASMVEAGLDNELIVGLTHEACLLADDRVLGTIRNQFFEEHPELVNFDPNAWFRALHGGQIAFAHAERARSYRTILTWGGRRLRGPAGPFVIEMLLEGGGREFVTVRNSIDRFSKNDADNFVEEFNKTNHERRDSNPFYYLNTRKRLDLVQF